LKDGSPIVAFRAAKGDYAAYVKVKHQFPHLSDTMISHHRFVLTLSFALLVLPTAARGKDAASTNAPTILDLYREYKADHGSLRTAFELPASEEWLDREQQLDEKWKVRLEKLDIEPLNARDRAEYLLLRSEVQGNLDDVALARKRLAEITQYVPFRGTIHELERSRRKWNTPDWRTTATKIAGLAEAVKQAREKLPKPGDKKLTAPVAMRAAGTVRSLHELLKRWYTFYDGYQPNFAWWVKKPYVDANKQLDDYAKQLREEIAGQKGKEEDPLVGEPIGAEAVAKEIRRQWLPYTADELIAIGEREFAWGETEMKKAAREMGLGDDWKAALAKVKADFSPPGEQDELVARTARESIEFVKRRELVTVPQLCDESWGLTMISPETLKVIPYAAYNGHEMMVAYANAEQKQDDKLMVMEGNNRHFTHLVIPHELIPGHHLQQYYESRGPDRPFSTPFYVEGWALYWELRYWDLGWSKTPEDRIGMIFWRMTRAARVFLTLKYHLGRMKPDEMVSFLMDRIGHEKLGARGEVRRFISAEPLYQVGYLIGGRQLLALHDEMVGPGKLTERQYHDAVLKQSPMPIELLRAALTGTKLPKDAKPDWRFAKP
jgi:hypothetical protein